MQGYQVVYVLDPILLSPKEVVAPQRIEQDMGAVIAINWQRVLGADAMLPVDLLIIHQSALPVVDKEWVQAAYGRGVVISFINVPLNQRLEVLGMTCCQDQGEPAPMEAMGEFFL